MYDRLAWPKGSIKMELLKLNLQMFAEGEGETTGDEGNIGENNFTPITDQSTLDALTNKAVQAALAKKQKQYEADLQAKIQEEVNKQKEYSQLSDEDRRNKELEDEKAQFEKEKAEFKYKTLLVEVKNDLADKGLPTDIADIVAVAGDDAKSLDNVKRLAKVIEDARAEERKAAIRQSEPSNGGNGTSTPTNRGAELARKNKVTLTNKPL